MSYQCNICNNTSNLVWYNDHNHLEISDSGGKFFPVMVDIPYHVVREFKEELLEMCSTIVSSSENFKYSSPGMPEVNVDSSVFVRFLLKPCP